MARIHRWLAGSDGPGKHTLPVGEFLHPAPLVALVLLGLNDHWLKGAGVLPGSVTGKLSDFAGLLFFPLLCTAVADLALMAIARMTTRAIDFSLSRVKLAAACAATAGLFLAIKLSPAAAEWVAQAFSQLGFSAGIVPDPTDLVALPMLGVAYLLGRAEIARVPLGRLEVVERAWRRGNERVPLALADITLCGGSPSATERLGVGLATYFRTGDDADANAALAELRGTSQSDLRAADRDAA